MQYKKILLSILVVVVGAIVYYFVPPVKYWTQNPTSFEECKKANGGVWYTNRVLCEFRGQTFKEKLLKIGAMEDTNIQSTHPYPNSRQGTELVWSYTLTHPGSTNLKLHFKKIELRSYQKLINKGETEVRAIVPVKGVDLDYPNNIDVFPADMERMLSGWSGDYIVVRDAKRTIIAIVGGSCPHAPLGYQDQCLEDGEGFWLLQPVEGETAIIELYADEKENGFGIHVDKYTRGFTDKEKERVNQETMDQYLKDCKEQGIPPEQCLIPK